MLLKPYIIYSVYRKELLLEKLPTANKEKKNVLYEMIKDCDVALAKIGYIYFVCFHL